MNCRENHLPQQLPDTAEEESSKPRWGVRLSSLALPWSCKELCKCLFSAILPLTRLPVVLHWKGELSLKMNNSFSGKRMNSLLESQINDLQGWFFFFLVGENYAMVLLSQIGIKNGLKFPVQNCIPVHKEKDTHVHRKKIYSFGENLFPLREIIACFKIMKKEDRKCSPTESSLIMSAFIWLTHAQLCVRGFNLQHRYLPLH